MRENWLKDKAMPDKATCALVIVTFLYSTITFFMAYEMHRANSISLRPYVKIVQVIENGVEKSLGSDDKTKKDAYIYKVVNVGDVPAHITNYKLIITELDKNGKAINEINVPRENITESTILFPKDENIRTEVIGQNIIFKTSEEEHKYRFRITIEYTGIRGMENKKYFYLREFETIVTNNKYTQMGTTFQDAN